MHSRNDMIAELGRTFVPELRSIGFKGSMPHFFRERQGHVDLACVQFAGAGGSFAVELSYLDRARTNFLSVSAKTVVAKQIRVSQTTCRLRLGAADETKDFWFSFEGERPYGISGTPAELAERVVSLLRSQAVPWWESRLDSGS